MRLTFIDAGVLIAAIRGNAEVARRALEVLNDPERSSRNGLSALDALHGAAALSSNAEMVTTEKSGKPLHRLTSIKVTTIHPG